MTQAEVAQDRRRGRPSALAITVTLLALAAVGWWWTLRSGPDMTGGMSMGEMPMDGMDSMAMAAGHAMSFGGFLLMWLAMMTAMMFPAISPVVKLYGRAAAAGRVAPLPFFVSGYIAVWTSLAIPAYFAWRALMDPIATGETWAAYLAGGVLVAAAVWQLTPLKSICLRHCRSPMSVFMQHGSKANTVLGAARMGATHGAYCVGCCWALMAILVALGTMNLAWMLGLAALIFIEKNAPMGERIAQGVSIVLLAFGLILFVRPETLAAVT